MLTMHVCLLTEPPNPTEIIRDIKSLLQQHYGIGHCTIELEVDDCSDINRQA